MASALEMRVFVQRRAGQLTMEKEIVGRVAGQQHGKKKFVSSSAISKILEKIKVEEDEQAKRRPPGANALS
ncbi:MAG TPA: hypothetical protein VGH51_21385 [Candidatus Angelobacter sp.]|jgi:hypothetical protein